jgi:hypothetical protein
MLRDRAWLSLEEPTADIIAMSWGPTASWLRGVVHLCRPWRRRLWWTWC